MHYRIAAFVAAALIGSTALAQTSPSPSAPTSQAAGAKTTSTKPAKAPVVRTAKSLDCSKQADAKGLHGKPRKSFMSSCKHA